MLSLSVQWAPLMMIKLYQAMAWVPATTQTLAKRGKQSQQFPSQTYTGTQTSWPPLNLNSGLSTATAVALTLSSELPAHL